MYDTTGGDHHHTTCDDDDKKRPTHEMQYLFSNNVANAVCCFQLSDLMHRTIGLGFVAKYLDSATAQHTQWLELGITRTSIDGIVCMANS